MFQGKSVCILGLLEPKLPARKGSVLCLRSATFLRRMRVEGEGHLTAARLEKASRQLTLGSSAVAGKGSSRLCLLCSQGGISGSGGGLGGGRRNLWWYVCQEAGGLGHLPFSVPSFWRGGGAGAVESGADVQGLQADLLILCQVRQACFGGCFLSIGLHSCLADLLPWPGWASGHAQESGRANDKCNSV